jgi:tungstate transport system ATP-binding protein
VIDGSSMRDEVAAAGGGTASAATAPEAAEADAPVALAARSLTVRRGSTTLVEVDTLELKAGQVHVLLGANGAGKSTLLKALNGLEPFEGELFFEGSLVRTAADRLALRRHTAAVFQKPYLLNTTVRRNVESGLRLRGVDRAEVRRRAAAAAELLGVTQLADRRPQKLSGGEAQRVSIARALAVEPTVIFLDEPLSSLDPPTRRSLTDDLLAIFSSSAMAVVWVTHDRDEALTVADTVSFMDGGRVTQSGPALRVFSRPASTTLATFLGLDSYLEGSVTVKDGRHVLKLASGLEVHCGEGEAGAAVACLPPEDVVLFSSPPSRASSSLRNVLEGRVVSVTPSGRLLRVETQVGQLEVAALVTRAAFEELGLTVGGPVTVAFKAAAVHPIPRHGRRP